MGFLGSLVVRRSFAIQIGLLSFLFSGLSQAAIYGSDDRKDVKDSPRMERLARSVAQMVSPVYVNTNDKGLLDLDFATLTDTYDVCPSQPFARQPVNPIACTGFLIAPDLLMTAGHCMINVGETQDEVNAYCSSFSWLFDYQLDNNGEVATQNVDPAKLYNCKRVVHAVHDYDYTPSPEHYEYKRDFAIIQLDRPVVGRQPFKISETDIRFGDRISTIGFPSGLPAKFSSQAMVFDVSNVNYVRTDLDVIGGNSGGPVFNDQDEVVGIVVRSFPDADYIDVDAGGSGGTCSIPNRCSSLTGECLSKDEYPIGTQVQRARGLIQMSM